ncbi:MAG TPA: PepSY domain-containing protein [Microlunatus sp.]|nr:PepSY domain-containing protein [Microlunatus sp.]
MTGVVPSTLRHALLVIGLPGLTLLAACGADEVPPGPEPTSISIAPSGAPPGDAPSATTPSGSRSTRDPGASPSVGRVDALGAVAAAEAAVADSSAVGLSRDDDDSGVWEVTLRAGENGRSLRIGQDAAVLGNSSEQLDTDQRGEQPTVTIQRAIQTAQQRVVGGVVTDAELTSETGRRVWDVSVEAAGGDRELWIDAASGEVLREEAD